MVYALIRHRAIDLARSSNRRVIREQTVVDTSDTAGLWFDSSAEARERTQILETAVKELPSIYRDVVTLKIWSELTFEEIASTLEISPNTTASRYRYGLDMLRRQLKPNLLQ